MPTFQVMTQKMPEIFVPSVFALVDDISAVALLETCQARACVCVHSSLYDYVQEFWGWVCWCVLGIFPLPVEVTHVHAHVHEHRHSEKQRG